MPDMVEWNGSKWWWYKDYYKNRRGKLLHRAIYEQAHGKIPAGCHVHHRDGDKRNNDLANLECLTASEHVRSHPPRGVIAWSAEQRGVASRKGWENRQPEISKKCERCGKEFLATFDRARFCSKYCKGRRAQDLWRKSEKGKAYLREYQRQRREKFPNEAKEGMQRLRDRRKAARDNG